MDLLMLTVHANESPVILIQGFFAVSILVLIVRTFEVTPAALL